MATEITQTLEMNIYLSSADDEATRTLKLINPNTDVTLAQVTAALAPALGLPTALEGETVYFFYDDGNQGGYDKPMTKVSGAEIVRIQKQVTRLE